MPHRPPADQHLTDPAFHELERGQVRHEADRAILAALRTNVAQGRTRRKALSRLNEAVAVLHRDLDFYRNKLLAEIAQQTPARHLRSVATSAADTADALGYRTTERG